MKALFGKEVPIETTPEEVLAIIRVKVVYHHSLTFSDEDFPSKGITHTRSLQITIKCMGAKVSMVLIDNGSALNVCSFRIALKIGLDMETIIPSPLTVKNMTTLQDRLQDWPIGFYCGISCDGYHS